MFRYLRLVIIIPALFFTSAHGGSADISEYVNNIYSEYSKGNYHKVYDRIEKLVREMPQHPETSLFLSDLVDLVEIAGPERVEETLRHAYQKVEAMSQLPDKKSVLLRLNLALEELLYKIDPARAASISAALNPLRLWQLVGPVSRYGPGDLYYPFIPEKTFDVTSNIEKKDIVVKNLSGELDLKKYLYPQSGVAYAVASFPVSSAVKVRIYSEAYYKVFINGQEVLVNEPGNYQKQRLLMVKDTQGITLKLKVYSSDSWKFRVLVSDVDDAPLALQASAGEKYSTPCRVHQLEEYSFNSFIKLFEADPFRGHVNLAHYYSELDSLKCIEHFNKALDIKDDSVVKYLLGAQMIRLSKGDRNSSFYSRGWRIVDETARRCPDFIPARGKLIERGTQGDGLLPSLKEGRELIRSVPDYLPSCLDYADLLTQLGYEKEFSSFIEECKKRFPYSQNLYLQEAFFYRTRNRDLYLEALEKSLGLRYHHEAVKKLIQEYIDRGDYIKAMGMLKKYNKENEFAFEEIALLIKKQNYTAARSLLLREVAQINYPLHYYNLGFISKKEQEDPLMYWLKSLKLKPSFYALSDYMTCLQKGLGAHQLADYLLPVDLYELDKKAEHTQSPATVLLREYIYDVKPDGSCRALCRDIIKIQTEAGADKWGEYPVPFKTGIHPLRIRVYRNKDEYSDYFEVQSVNTSKYITLSGVKKDSIVEVAYITDELSRKKQNGLMFHVPIQFMQDFDEPVQRFRFSVIAPEKLKICFTQTSGMNVTKSVSQDGEAVSYTIDIKALQPIHKEYFSGPAERTLPFVSFSLMNNEQDFLHWYTGHIKGKDKLYFFDEVSLLQGADIKETVNNVYRYVVSEIDLSSKMMYYPDSADDTFYRRGGSAEDRAILARALLKKYGISSFFTFARNKFLPSGSSCIAPEFFTHMLLYVPIEEDRGMWLDFSHDNLPCSMVDNSVLNTRALVLFSNRGEYKTVQAENASLKRGQFVITVDEKGGAEVDASFMFSGNYSSIADYFKDSRYHEETTHALASSIFPSIDVSAFSITNYNQQGKPINISFKGFEPNAVLIGSGKMLFQPVVNKSDVYSYIQYPRRVLDLIIDEPLDEEEKYTYNLPHLYAEADIDQKHEINSSFGSALITITKRKGSHTLKVEKHVKINEGIIKPQDYGEFLQFCLKIKEVEFQNIVLTRD